MLGKDENDRFTTIPLKALSDQVRLDINLNTDNFQL